MHTFPEPPDGGVLLIRHYPHGLDPDNGYRPHVWTAIYRSDEDAITWAGPNGADDERWFANNEVGPRSIEGWTEHLQADAVHASGERLTGEDA